MRALAAAPAELGELAASAGDDGAVCLLSLAAGACARVLPGPPGAAPARLAWAPALGYVAALYTGGGGPAGAVGLVWDLHSGARDRVVTGAAAAALLDNFGAMPGGGGSGGARAAVRLAEPCAAGAPPRLPDGLALLEVDAEALLAGPAKPRAPRAALGAAADAAAGCPAAALAQALAQLHVWGLDAGVDAALLALLDEAGLARLPGGAAGAPAGDAARVPGPGDAAGAGAPPGRAALGLGQGAAAGAGGGVTLQLPSRVALPGASAAAPPRAPPGAADHAGRSGWEGRVPNGAHGGAAARAAEAAAPAWRPGLLTGDGAFVAARLLAAVGVAKALMGRPPATEARCGGCAAAAALYAVGVRGALPGLAAPALAAYVARWQARRPAEAPRPGSARRRRRVGVRRRGCPSASSQSLACPLGCTAFEPQSLRLPCTAGHEASAQRSYARRHCSWQAESEALREATRALLAAATDPRACASPHAYAELLAGAGTAAASLDVGAESAEVRPRRCHGAVYKPRKYSLRFNAWVCLIRAHGTPPAPNASRPRHHAVTPGPQRGRRRGLSGWQWRAPRARCTRCTCPTHWSRPRRARWQTPRAAARPAGGRRWQPRC